MNQAPEVGGIPIGVIFTLVVLIGVPILWMCRHIIGGEIRQANARSVVRATGAANENQWAQVNATNESERAGQLAALQAALPTVPPSNMRVTIQFNSFKKPAFEQRYVEGLTAAHQNGVQNRHSIDMIMEFSEEERSIIRTHKLDRIVLEDRPKYSTTELRDMRLHDEDYIQSLGGGSAIDLTAKEIARSVAKTRQELNKDERVRITFGDMLVSPYSREFDTTHEAKQFAENLKTKILPEMKKLIEQYRDHKQSETVEF